jgi:hypothetical protein
MLLCIIHFLDIVKECRGMSNVSLDMVKLSLGNLNLSYDLSARWWRRSSVYTWAYMLIIVLPILMCSNNRPYSSCIPAKYEFKVHGNPNMFPLYFTWHVSERPTKHKDFVYLCNHGFKVSNRRVLPSRTIAKHRRTSWRHEWSLNPRSLFKLKWRHVNM